MAFNSERIEDFARDRVTLWKMACAGQLSVDQLYAQLHVMREQAGESLYPRMTFERAPRR